MPNPFPNSMLMVGDLIALNAPWVVGLIVLILVLLCSNKLIPAWGMKAFTRAKKRWTGAKLECPNAGCYKEIELPIYVCPKCATHHADLQPSPGPIWEPTLLSKRCECGTLLPTVGRDRDTLPALCSHCQKPLKLVAERTLRIPLVAGPSAGKSSYLMANMAELSVKKAEGKLDLNFPDPKQRQYFEACDGMFQRGEPLQKTQETSPTAMVVQVKDLVGQTSTLQLFDAAGELFEQVDELRRQEYFGNSDGIVFLIDPFSIDSVRFNYEAALSENEAAVRPSAVRPQETFERLVTTLRELEAARLAGRFTVPVAVVISKADALGLISEITGRSSDGTEFAISHSDSSKVRAWLKKNGENNLVTSLEREFSQVRYFACSALGRLPDETNRPFSPKGTSQPTFWLLAHHGLEMDQTVSFLAKKKQLLAHGLRYGLVAVIATILVLGDQRLFEILSPPVLRQASAAGNLAIVKHTLERGAVADTPDGQGDTALTFAARHARIEILHELLLAGANPRHANLHGETPLHVYTEAAGRSPEGAKHLLNKRADVNDADDRGRTPLVNSVLMGNQKIVSLLLRAKANANAVAPGRIPVVHVAMDRAVEGSFGRDDDQKIVLDLLAHGADVNARDPQNQHLLAKAILADRPSLAEALLKRKADPDALARDLKHPIHLAIDRELPGMVTRLLKAGADPNTASLTKPLLWVAFDKNDPDSATLLIQHGANANATTGPGYTLLERALEEGNPEFTELAIRHATPNLRFSDGTLPIFWAIKKGDLSLVDRLLDSGASTTLADENGLPPLMWAIYNEAPELFNMLYQRKAWLGVTDAAGNTPLHMALDLDREAFWKPLAEGGSNLLHRNKQGLTPIEIAWKKGFKDLAWRWIRSTGSVNLRFSNGSPVLCLAVRENNLDMVSQLLDLGADRELRDGEGYTAWDLAHNIGYGEIARLLRPQEESESLFRSSF